MSAELRDQVIEAIRATDAKEWHEQADAVLGLAPIREALELVRALSCAEGVAMFAITHGLALPEETASLRAALAAAEEESTLLTGKITSDADRIERLEAALAAAERERDSGYAHIGAIADELGVGGRVATTHAIRAVLAYLSRSFVCGEGERPSIAAMWWLTTPGVFDVGHASPIPTPRELLAAVISADARALLAAPAPAPERPACGNGPCGRDECEDPACRAYLADSAPAPEVPEPRKPCIVPGCDDDAKAIYAVCYRHRNEPHWNAKGVPEPYTRAVEALRALRDRELSRLRRGDVPPWELDKADNALAAVDALEKARG